ncbi:ornithine carbamoyltransferase, partial [Salmonella enterica]|nr:ornithine carbamoyltransferase [Salmonella enterica]
LKELGFESTADIIKQHSDKVKYTIDGDIWVDPDNPHTVAIVISSRLLGVNKEHTEFNIVPRRKDGDYYRIRK